MRKAVINTAIHRVTRLAVQEVCIDDVIEADSFLSFFTSEGKEIYVSFNRNVLKALKDATLKQGKMIRVTFVDSLISENIKKVTLASGLVIFRK